MWGITEQGKLRERSKDEHNSGAPKRTHFQRYSIPTCSMGRALILTHTYGVKLHCVISLFSSQHVGLHQTGHEQLRTLKNLGLSNTGEEELVAKQPHFSVGLTPFAFLVKAGPEHFSSATATCWQL